ncbi:MAG: diaminobutyrate-2-oxoglutarate transaminase, partial [Yoonia sp.]
MMNVLTTNNETSVFNRVESGIRSYSRSFPKLFNKAVGATIYDAKG